MDKSPEEELKRRVLNRGFGILHDLVDIGNLIVQGDGAKIEEHKPLVPEPRSAKIVKKVVTPHSTGDSTGKGSQPDKRLEDQPKIPKDRKGKKGTEGGSKDALSETSI